MITHDIDEAIVLSDSIVILGWKPVSVIRLFKKWELVSKDIIYNLLTDVY
jgi:ABC-type nitrate/sulfonate/bicarbonate transport system ATPase subunit